MQTPEGAEKSKKTNQRRNSLLRDARHARNDKIKMGKKFRSERDAIERSALAAVQQERRATEDEAEKVEAWAEYHAAKGIIDEELGVEVAAEKEARAERKAADKKAKKEESVARKQLKKDRLAAKIAAAKEEVDRELAEEAAANAANAT